jgi:dipeptidyl aminopeptidase/acylaminoacyl peptidase
MACVLEEVDQPGEVFVGELGGEPRRVSAFNTHLKEVALGRGETVEWLAPDGLRIEGVLIYPANYQQGKRYPLIAHIHGGPTWQWLMRFLGGWHDWGQWLAAQGYAVLLPNPRGSAGRGREYAWNNQRNWGHGDFGDVLSGVDALIERGIADPDRLGIGGWSYGGYMTAWAIGHTDRFKAAIVGAGVTDLLSFQAADIPAWLPTQMMLAPSYREPEVYLRSSPITYVADAKTPTLILHGASDERVRLGQGKELYHALQALGVPTEMVIYPREPHIFQERNHQRDVLTRVAAWFDRWVKGAQS